MNNLKISKVFLSGGASSSIVIPIDMARKYGIDRHTYVSFEDNDQGIIIKKVEIK
jgi:hypothetical protein